jgi:hypothetical protein
MRRMILGGLLAASVALPGVAFAKMAQTAQTVSPPPQQQQFNTARTLTGQSIISRSISTTGSIGGGMQLGNEPGHTAGPGGAKVDEDARGPVNDVQVGRGTNDTPQNKNPPPER